MIKLYGLIISVMLVGACSWKVQTDVPTVVSPDQELEQLK